MDTVRVFGHHVHGRSLLLALVHAALVLGAVYLAAFLLDHHIVIWTSSVRPPLLGQSLIFVAILLLSMVALGLYQVRLRDRSLGVIARLVFSAVLALIAMTLISALFPPLDFRHSLYSLALLLALIGLAVTHLLFYSIVDHGHLRRRILFYGAGQSAASLLSRLRRKTDQRLFALVGCVPLNDEVEQVDSARLVRTQQRLRDYVREHRIDEIVVAMDDRRGGFPADELLACRLDGVEVTHMLNFYERHTGRIKTELLQPGDFIFSDGFHQGVFHVAAKRTLDVIVSLTLLAVTWPLIVFAAVAIKLEDGWRAPVLYRQVRCGRFGIPFQIVKLRSMRVDAEAPGEAKWATKGDPRITRVGRVLRKYRIDELPQLFNVLGGSMSLVGPRPERPEFVEQLAEKHRFYNLRHEVKPGITGWAQLCYPYGDSEEDSQQKLEYDLYYAKNGSLFLDLVILIGTVEVILFRKGAQ